MADARRAEYADAHRERLDDDGEDFIEHVFEHYFSEKERSFEKIYASYDDEPGDGEALRPYYERFVEQFDVVVRDLKEQGDLFAEDRLNWLHEGERGGLLQLFPDGLKGRIAEKVVDLAEVEWDRRRRHLAHGKAYYEVAGFEGQALARKFSKLVVHQLDPALVAAQKQADSARYLQLRVDEGAAKTAMENAERDLSHAKEALAHVSKPEGLVATIFLLAGIALAGMVLPLIEMTNGDTALSTTRRWIYTGLFLASLVAFFVYLTVEIVRLNKVPKVQSETTPETT